MQDSILIKHSLLFTMQDDGLGVQEDGAVYVEGNSIGYVGPTEDVSLNKLDPDTVIDGKNKKAVLPGFIDGHLHSSETLIKGLAQDVPENEWMHKTIDPFSTKMTEQNLIQGTKLSVLEGIHNGTTTFTDYGYPIRPLIENVYLPLKLRMVAVPNINAMPQQRDDLEAGVQYSFDRERGSRLFEEAISLINQYDGAGDERIQCMIGPQCADMVPLKLLKEIFDFAEEENLMVHMHVAQGDRERQQMNQRYNQSTVGFLKDNDFLSGGLLAAHCHGATEEELGILARSGTKMVSCQSSIAMIDGMVPPLAEYLRMGGEAALGTDQAAGNNNQSILAELKVAALLNKVRDENPTSLKAWQVLRLATIDGARALGIDDLVGSIEEGKRADLVVFDLQNPTLTPKITNPLRNIAHNIVYAARGNEIEMVLIDGNVVKKGSNITILDEDDILCGAQKAAEEVVEKGAEEYLTSNSEMVRDFRDGKF